MAPEAVTRRVTAGTIRRCWICCIVFAIGCGRGSDSATIAWTIEPSPPIAGKTTVVAVTLKADDGAPAAGATLQLDAHMSHPGMAPVTADVIERRRGEYEARLQFSMAGDWILVLSGTLANGRRLTKEIRVPSVQPAAGATPVR
ncbi:MAG TPA: FixH family protein [Vicinamibacterales bacterium]|nr:FixH family protein [Vicinamibacterales bacterium]